jgi:hypothetical protein
MEDVMQARVCRESETISHPPDAFNDLEQSGVAWVQLALGRRSERMGGSMEKSEQHPCAHVELHLTMALIIVALGVLLGLKKTLVNLRQEHVAVLQHGVPRLCLGHPGVVWKEGWQRSAVHNLER